MWSRGCVERGRRRSRKTTRPAKAARATNPPTTPPAIAPLFVEEEEDEDEDEDEGVDVDEDVVFDEVVVLTGEKCVVWKISRRAEVENWDPSGGLVGSVSVST